MLTLPSAVLVGIMAEALSQDPLTRPALPLPLFLIWFLGSWMLFSGVSGWIATRYWKRIFSLTGYIYTATAFVALATVAPNPGTIGGWWGELIGWVMIGWLAGTGLVALLAASIALGVANAKGQRNQAPLPPSPTMRERFRERAERFSRTRPP